ncbi:MAG: hypothetical protein BWY83_00455 [bacterium ADurb.Bin478]|nr:MAG: hypothetical protein BWY83_00455 [bacterium ADurb.Bin478]
MISRFNEFGQFSGKTNRAFQFHGCRHQALTALLGWHPKSPEHPTAAEIEYNFQPQFFGRQHRMTDHFEMIIG